MCTNLDRNLFPTHDDFRKQRRFSHDWLKNYGSWLVYSKVCDGGFCLPCMMFARVSRGSQDLGALVTRPLKTFKATELLRKHGSQMQYHKTAMIDMHNFIDRMEQRQPSVCDMAHSAHAQLIQKNRLKLISILKCEDIEVVKNFLSLVVTQGTSELSSWIRWCNTKGTLCQSSKNATYSSKTIQNELIEVAGEWIWQKILDEVKKAHFFTVLADVSNTEQLSLVLRFVDDTMEIREEFLEFVPCI